MNVRNNYAFTRAHRTDHQRMSEWVSYTCCFVWARVLVPVTDHLRITAVVSAFGASCNLTLLILWFYLLFAEAEQQGDVVSYVHAW